ncbi:tripartite tricarboxylate transporter TctB family protein [Salinicola peritrichatus]|uniref:tripartite tricarboxylate transporter TctB family protein n=1 Tax=Salinicola peritrichatus TaxID=1267424 RepID=UPI000DA1D437|nr:tripartite tricarboxylate transporter TctB family protein [Salinicola peritrichatus]
MAYPQVQRRGRRPHLSVGTLISRRRAQADPHAEATGADETTGNGATSNAGDRRRGLGVPAVILGICAFLWWETTRFPSVPASLSQNISAAFFPRVLIAAVAILAVVLVVFDREKLSVRLPSRATLLTGVGITAGVALIPWLGVLPVVFLVALGLPLLWGVRRWQVLLAYSLAVPIAIWVVFTLLLQLHFPTGAF